MLMAKWIIDVDHSVAKFSVRHFMIANIVGLFSKISGTINYDPSDPSRLSAEAEIKVRSLTTGHQARDEHLLSPDYFDAEKYPKMIFKTTRVEPVGENRCKVAADLTLHGITRPVTLEVETFGPVKSPFSEKVCMGFCGTARINREDFGMTSNYAMEGGGFVVGKEIEVTFDLEADLATD
jgi:polyisoprenoid-binding protein YceI